MTIGENVRAIRMSKDIAVKQITEKTGLSKSTISDIENGHSSPTATTLEKIAGVLGCSVTDFFDMDIENNGVADDLCRQIKTMLKESNAKLTPEQMQSVVEDLFLCLEVSLKRAKKKGSEDDDARGNDEK